MQESYVYDKAKYHYGGNYPETLPNRQAFVHTGLYLGWIIENNLYSEDFKQGMIDEINAFNARKITGTQIYELCDGALIDDMLSDEGNAFTQYYFDFNKGSYLQDYENMLATNLPSLYYVEDTWENYDKIKRQISKRFNEWKNPQQGGLWNRVKNIFGF